MKRLVALLLVLGLSAPSWGAYALVSTAHLIAFNPSNFDGFTSSSFDSTGSTELIVGLVYDFGDSSGFTFADSKSNGWTVRSERTTPGGARIRIYECNLPCTVGTGHTFTLGGTVIFAALAAQGFTGQAASPFDVEASSDSAGAPVNFLNTNSISPTQDNELIIAVVRTGSASNGTTVDSSFVYTDQTTYSGSLHYGFGMTYIIKGASTSGVAVNPKFTMGGGDVTQMSAAIASFKASSGASTPTFGTINNPVPGGL